MKIGAAITVAAGIVAYQAAYCQDGLSSVKVIRDCGRERWDVKILRDVDTSMIDFAHPKSATVDELTRMRPFTPTEFMSRQWSERIVYVVNAYLYGYSQSKDRDIQLYLRDPKSGRTMLASLPDPDCPEVGATPRAAIYRAAREWVHRNLGERADSPGSPILVKVTGVGVYSRLNNQIGMAENGLALHPVIALERIDLLASTGTVPIAPTVNPPAPEKSAVKRVRHYKKVRRHYYKRHRKAHRRYKYKSRRFRRAQRLRIGAVTEETRWLAVSGAYTL